jgi:hypothetical protein
MPAFTASQKLNSPYLFLLQKYGYLRMSLVLSKDASKKFIETHKHLEMKKGEEDMSMLLFWYCRYV